MKKYFTVIFCFLLLFACTEKTQKKSQTPQKEIEIFLIYGELSGDDYLDPWNDENDNSITEKYGFKLKRIAGCDVSGINLKAIHLHNNKAFQAMNKKYGKDWMLKFEKETNYKLSIPFE